MQGNPQVVVLVPEGERISEGLKQSWKKHGFTVARFPFVKGRADNFVALLKCQAFGWVARNLSPEEIAAFVDADTCCLKRVELPTATRGKVLRGSVAIAPDICDRHFGNYQNPWYLPAGERLTYVNTGVMFVSRQSLPFLRCISRLSHEAKAFIGDMQDQTVINFALGRSFPSGLVLLNQKFNRITGRSKDSVILHFAGGAGLLGQQDRNHDHRKACETVLMNT